jgi:hypothetical protein
VRNLPCRYGCPTTGGLRPPLLCWCTDVCERKNDFCDVRTPIRKSAARQPAVARQTERCAAKIRYCSPTMRRTNTSDTRSSSEGAVPCRCDYPEPRLADASRSSCTCGCGCRYALFRDGRVTLSTADSRQPLLVHVVCSLKNNEIRGAQTHVSQERRGSPTHHNGVHTTALRQAQYLPDHVGQLGHGADTAPIIQNLHDLLDQFPSHFAVQQSRNR